MGVSWVVAPAEKKRGQAALSFNAVASLSDNSYSLLLPLQFQKYLDQVFFTNFDDGQVNILVSRNSAIHGVAAAADFTLETSMLGSLICAQLFHCFASTEPMQSHLDDLASAQTAGAS